MKTTSGWSAKLTRSIVLKDGTRLVTLGDVRAFILKQPEHIQERGSWQHAAELMILAAERGGSIEAATTQIEDALFLEARYVRPWPKIGQVHAKPMSASGITELAEAGLEYFSQAQRADV